MEKTVEERIDQLEKILIEISTYKKRCKYPYIIDMQSILKKYSLLKSSEYDKEAQTRYRKNFDELCSKRRAIIRNVLEATKRQGGE